jgi:predicted metal-binding membrane protein
MLWHYHKAVGKSGAARPGRLTVLVGVGYFFVWTLLGLAAVSLGIALAAVEIEQPALARAAPAAIGVVVLIGGAVQFTAWKARHLAGWRELPQRCSTLPADAGTAWRLGLRLGRQCGFSCAGLTAILLAAGVMDAQVMVAVTAAITIERLAPAGERFAQAVGVVIVAAGSLLIAHAAGLG